MHTHILHLLLFTRPIFPQSPHIMPGAYQSRGSSGLPWWTDARTASTLHPEL